MRVNSLNSLSYGKLWPKYEGRLKNTANGKTNNALEQGKNHNPATEKGGIYVTPVQTTKAQEDTIQKALNELSKVEFHPNDVLYMKNLGVNLPFQNGNEAVEYLKSRNIEVAYAEFSNPNVHACLDTSDKIPNVLLNSKYKELTSFAAILAISEAFIHESGHAKDGDSENSIQEEINCLALNVLTHQYYKKTYPDVFKDQNSPLFFEGVNLYDSLFFDFDPEKKALKKRISEKYGFLNVSSRNHPGSQMAYDIKTRS